MTCWADGNCGQEGYMPPEATWMPLSVRGCPRLLLEKCASREAPTGEASYETRTHTLEPSGSPQVPQPLLLGSKGHGSGV